MSIIKQEYLIKAIHLVMRSCLFTGQITSNLKGRHSDCFVYVLSGKTQYTFKDGSRLCVQEDDILYLPKNSRYIMDIVTERYEVIYVDFDFDAPPSNVARVFRTKNTTEFKNAFFSLNRKWIAKKNAYRSDCLATLYKLYALIIQNEQIPYLPTAKRTLLNNAINKITDSFSNPALSVNELALLSGMSEGHFRRIFKNVFSVSPAQYIKTIRIEHAKELLRLKEHSVSDIAELSGFANTFYFCRIFKNETGMTPTQYRKIQSEQNGF